MNPCQLQQLATWIMLVPPSPTLCGGLYQLILSNVSIQLLRQYDCVRWNSMVKGKVKVQVFYSLISSLKELSSDFTFYPLVTGPVQSCAISTPRGAYSLAAVLAHWTYRTHCHLCPTRYSFSPESGEAFEGEVFCPRTQHLDNVPRLRGE